jgi:GTP-binding protein EngB required for normal cell division
MGNEDEPIKQTFDMCVNLIGDSLDQFLYCISNNTYESYASQRPEKKSLYDYWDYLYNPGYDFFGQLAITLNRLKLKKDSLTLDFKECVVVRVSDISAIEIQYVLEKMNSLNREHYIPLMLFLCNSFELEDLKKFNFDQKKYSKIDKRIIFFEKYEADINNPEKMRKIRYRLERFCSYYNELGDRFTIGENDNRNDYDLTEMNFPFTVNICCVGRFGKGKSTGVNCILGEKNAKENKSGTTATMKINYYQVNQFPVKIYDLPGFENDKTVNNAIKQFKYLNDEIRQLQDQIHIFLYFIKSTDERMFTEMEFAIFEQIFQHKDSFILYVLTHSSEKTDKKEIYDMINTGVRGVINHHKSKKQEIYPNDLEYYQNIYFKMAATSDNCVFVNFHETDKNKLYGISDFFEKIVLFVERTDAYRKFQKDSCMNEVEFRIRIEEEAKIRKKRAAAIISRHKIGSAIAGLLPGVDYLANRFFIKKDAMRKAGQIFGFDIDELSNSIKYENDKNQKEMKNKGNNISNNESLMLKEENDKIPRPQASVIKENEEDKEKNELDNINKEKKKERDKKIKVSGYGAMYTCSAVSFGTSIPRILFAVGSVGLLAVSTVFSVVGCAVGAGVGYYLMKRHCEDLLDQFEQLFIQNADKVSNSLIFGINYLKNMAEYYKKQGC